tara:strand:+ start:1 stop:753 length:753 start_codon:yes stop_codon:yes gene_type:complete
MKSSRCKIVAVRDKISAKGLRKHGVNALAPGNPMMDGFDKQVCPESLKNFKRLILLCGSRMPEALVNFQRLINSLDFFIRKESLAILVATGSAPSVKLLEHYLLRAGYEKCFSSEFDIGQNSIWAKDNHKVFLGRGSFSKWSSWAQVGLANAGTATEQLVGLGIPCVSLPGNGPQFKFAFAKRQSRLLGGGVIPCKTYRGLAERVELLLRDEFLRERLVRHGQKRMGSGGGSFNLAKLINKDLFMAEYNL